MKLVYSYFYFVGCLLWLSVSFAQEGAKNYNNQFKTSLVRIFDPINPGLEMTYERRYKNAWSTQVSVSYITDIFNTTSYYKDLNGFRIGLEEKYFITRSRYVQPYAGVDLVYFQSSFQDIEKFKRDEIKTNQWGQEVVSSLRYSDTFTVQKTTVSFNLKIGVQVFLDRFVLESSAGIGIKYRDVSHSNRQYPSDLLSRYDLWIPSPKLNAVNEGRYLTLNIPVNVKIGYLF